MRSQPIAPFWYWENNLSKETCEAFIKEHYKAEEAIDGEYLGPNGFAITGEKRNTKICWVNNMMPLGLLLFNYILLANQKAGWNFDVSQIENVQVGEYFVGGHYDWHEDAAVLMRTDAGAQRKLSISLFLSDPNTYEGGDLLFEGMDKPITRSQGSLIVFPSFTKHTVSPITSGVRYSAVTWATGPYFK